MKIMTKYPCRHRVGLQGKLKLAEKGEKIYVSPLFLKGLIPYSKYSGLPPFYKIGAIFVSFYFIFQY
jgi:hypothetical protein